MQLRLFEGINLPQHQSYDAKGDNNPRSSIHNSSRVAYSHATRANVLDRRFAAGTGSWPEPPQG